jgi:flagellar biosynthesis repressor protein FlbT
MVLKLTLQSQELVVINGCAIRNTGRRHALTIESHADVIRGKDLIEKSEASTPVGRAYYLIQSALINAKIREELLPEIQKNLAELATVFGGDNLGHIFEAANYVSQGDLYKALRELRPVHRHEAILLERIAAEGVAASAATDERRRRAVAT